MINSEKLDLFQTIETQIIHHIVKDLKENCSFWDVDNSSITNSRENTLILVKDLDYIGVSLGANKLIFTLEKSHFNDNKNFDFFKEAIENF